MKRNLFKTLICSLACAVCAIVGVATVRTVSVSAEEISSAETVRELSSFTLTQTDGAGVRYGSSAQNLKEGGLRYEITMSKEDYDYIKSSPTYKDTVSFGVFIAPRDYHESVAGMTEVNVQEHISAGTDGSTVDNVYCWEQDEKLVGGTIKNGKKYAVQIINIQTKYLRPKDENTYHYYASITNILEKNYSREFIAYGYLKYTPAGAGISETEDVDTDMYHELGTTYYWASPEAGNENIDNARSIAWTASKLLETGKYKLPTANLEGDELEKAQAENANRRDVLYSGYLKKSIVTIKFQSGDAIQVGQLTDGVYGTNADSGMTMAYSYYNDGGNTFYQDQAVSAAGVNGFVYNCSDTALHYDVWHAKTTSNASQYSQVLIFDASGMIIEGRDGANGRWVTNKNVIRANAPRTTTHTVHEYSSTTVGEGNNAITTYTHLETTTTANFSTATARCFDIPAGGFAIIVANGTAKTSIANTNMQYGNFARIYFGTETSGNKELTSYNTEKAPLIYDTSTNEVIEVIDGVLQLPTYILKYGATDDNVKTAVGNIKIIDDNGTFRTDDDVSTVDIEVSIPDANSASKKDVLLSAGNTAQYTAKAVVLAQSITVKLQDASGNWITNGSTGNDKNSGVVSSTYFFNQAGGSYDAFRQCGFAFFTTDGAKMSTLTTTYMADGYGVAIVFDKYGKINRVYDAAGTPTYYDAQNLNGTTLNIAANSAEYITTAFNSLVGGEYMIVAAWNRNATDGSQSLGSGVANARQLFKNAVKAIGGQLTIYGVDFLSA